MLQRFGLITGMEEKKRQDKSHEIIKVDTSKCDKL
jgi:hypothetical protein